MINETYEHLARLTRKKKKQINIRNERGDITTESTDIKRRIRKYFEQLYANTFDNLDKTEKFQSLLKKK